MPTVRLFFTALFFAAIGHLSAEAQALDPAFGSPAIYAPGTSYSVTEQPDGKLVVVGNFTRINGTAVPRLIRFNADGTLDVAFNQRVGADAAASRVKLLDNGQLLLMGFTNVALKAGGLSRPGGLLRLNADGTADASFDAGSGPDYTGGFTGIDDVLPLPNGKMLVVGYFERFSGVQARSIVQLNADGTIDTSFRSGIGTDGEIITVAPVDNGQFLIGGYFSSYDTHACNSLARLNADGSFDSTFRTSFLASSSTVYTINVRPTGQLLIAGSLASADLPNGKAGLVRLLSNGLRDYSFGSPYPLDGSANVGSFFGNVVAVQTDGKILVQPFQFPLMRLNENGTPDLSYHPGDDVKNTPHSLTLLRSGKLLLPGYSTNFDGILDRPLIRLNADGSTDSSFQPLIQLNATISNLIRQPDGKLLISGSFSEINGQPARRLARLTADNKLDEAFSSTFANDIDQGINSLVLQPDGRILIATGPIVRRLLPDGQPDNNFIAAPFAEDSKVLLQPDGRILVSGNFTFYGGNQVGRLVRLTATGAHDPTFVVPTNGENSLAQANIVMVLQPNGQLIAGGYYRNAMGLGTSMRLIRYTSTGAIDSNFGSVAFTPATGSYMASFNGLTSQADYKVLVYGQFGKIGGQASNNLARLNSNGTLDTGFTAPATSGPIYKLTIQPNNRILLGGQFTANNLPSQLARLLPDGSPDASFGATAVPNSNVRTILTQPDGSLLIGGSFTSVSGQPSMALARLVASNVLHVQAPAAVAEQTTAWPVPAHGQLHVALAPTAHAQSLELLDALGRSVQQQALAGRQSTTLMLGELPAGMYLLRVTYAEGTVTRRVQVQ